MIYVLYYSKFTNMANALSRQTTTFLFHAVSIMASVDRVKHFLFLAQILIYSVGLSYHVLCYIVSYWTEW